ncbi:GSCOCT00014140001.2-RA-CDS [Cotesia congregata]|uniref:Gustatory receptor n=1 Tax=Cotesia congregata TaxID=51543 RepID=A0A8J2HRD5_COTCN|nr:GSCOCT00014140001.2-RA-CDS [Cotesia congregata]CAG5104160.1 gustatory receptor 71 [Cotesia congregata]
MYQNLYSSIHYRNLVIAQHVFFKILGLSPWTVSFPEKLPKNRNGRIKFCKFSYLGSFYNILLIILAISLSVFTFYQRYTALPLADALVTHSRMITFQLLSLLVMSLIFIIYTVRQKRMIIVLNKIYNVDLILQKYTFIKNCNSSKNDSVIINLIFILHLIISVFFLSVGLFLPSYFETLLRVAPWILFCWVIEQYTILLDMVRKRLKFINSYIMKLGPAEVDLEKSRPMFFIKPSILYERILHEVINIKHTYKDLCEICEDIACFYGESVLVVIMFNGSGVIVLSYFILLSFYGQIELPLIMCFNESVFILWTVFQLIALTTYVSLILKEVSSTHSKKFCVVTSKNFVMVHEKVEKELVNFLRELTFRKIKFTACEIISIDRSFLASVSRWYNCNLSNYSHTIPYEHAFTIIHDLKSIKKLLLIFSRSLN